MEKRTTFNRNTIGIMFAVPQILLIFTFFYWPAGQAVFWSLTLQQPWGGGNTWVGFDNFKALLSNADYWNSVTRSMVFAAISTTAAMSIGLLLAALTDRQLRGSNFYRVVLIWPYGIAAPALALGFRFILAPQAGIVAVVNQWWPGIWDPGLNGADAMASVIIAFSWKYIGYNFIFFLAAFQGIPRSLIEAAAMDGSSVLRRFKDIQFPLITPTIFFLLVINITESFQDSFGIVDIMTSGGPANATNLMVYKIYSDGFKGLDFSGAAAQSIILMVLIVLLTIFQFRFIERRVHYR
ncbi:MULTISPECIES: carbohydrate ABC transporter permease [unclassified Rhizobium]|uniref:carbohydrate ABC transporter permease n=1 Tax=unclassified Rhizobium TaxID=2613769 RepID=UPI001ADC3E6E|nr:MULTISPECIES: sugar ABC transporter permease [unclassified Rhizobium]MBO9098265.1 sugar ABC transporter permease [Rhizobium sp. L58/93]MBO9184461.1 sugar ABC transporter permease [Rhizobium sp. E27B/91]QXZ84668.1 sugar ABC transporter permease [Rhizobium sp. K1/93]QXZ91193.1 sugar ABC transporter permease [Rhizobium sp. K15/93]QYA00406.1 sugar ABC transporter permease [Rhizobium sp. B21/90]